MYFQARYFAVLSPLRWSQGLRLQLKKCLIAFLLQPLCIGWHKLSQMDCIQNCHRHSHARTRRILQFSYGLICTEQFPLQLARLCHYSERAAFVSQMIRTITFFVMGTCLQHFVFLISDQCCVVLKTSSDLRRIQKDLE